MICTAKGFGIVNKAEIDVFLELSCFFDDPVDTGNLISGSSAFSKISLHIWKFTVYVLLKPGLEVYKLYLNKDVKMGLSYNHVCFSEIKVKRNIPPHQKQPHRKTQISTLFVLTYKVPDVVHNGSFKKI